MESKEIFNTVFTLMARQPWLGAKHKELNYILFEECQCPRSREMLINIISSFLYLSADACSQALSSLAKEVMSEVDYKTTTQIVAMAADSGPDSSQEILYNLKYIFAELGWHEFIGVNTFGAAYKTYTRSSRNNIVVVDDFVGSGQTVIGRHKQLQRVFEGNGITDISISFKVLVSTKLGLDNVRGAGIHITAQHVICKAIDDHYPKEIAEEYRSLMTVLESMLAPEYGGRAMPSFGYNGAQAAYCRERANTPNSVFPIFWWPFRTDSESRLTILHRAMGDA